MATMARGRLRPSLLLRLMPKLPQRLTPGYYHGLGYAAHPYGYGYYGLGYAG